MSDNNWRHESGARAVVYSCCWLLLLTSSAPLYAAPPANALPQIAPTWVSHGSATQSVSGNTMTIDQTTAKAILNWKSFNIGKDATVQFNQPSANATALNLINDSGASEIFGQLNANGNVYLINNNGILFGQGAQVNVHGLVASTLNVDTTQFINSSPVNAINEGKAAFEGGTAANASVAVEAGATIATDSGGQVLMFAPTVVNAGTITTPDGQAILAASKDKVYLATSNNDPNLRGLLVEVDTGGDVTNVGTMVAERGNITLLGLAVNQNGRVRATTSVDVNGSIRLLARDKAQPAAPDFNLYQHALMVDDDSQMPSANTQVAIPKHTGTLQFGAGSVTEVVADTQLGADGKERTAPDAQKQYHSRIEAMAQTIVVEDSATLRAKSGVINLTATQSPEADPSQTSARNNSRIYVGKNATLDVSGENVALPMARRFIDVELRGDELKDSPLQRSGILRNKTVRVDIGIGSPLIADLQPSIAKQLKGLGERTTAGGSINLRSQGDVVFANNALLNTAGGSITYAAGLANTSKLVTKNGWLVDIGKADPNWTYAGVLGKHTETHKKWGPRVYGEDAWISRGVYREGFTEGEDSGALNIGAQTLYGFDLARIEAAAQRGTTQRQLDSLARGGSIDIVLGAVAGTEQDVVLARDTQSATLDVDDDIVEQTANISTDALNASGAGSFSLRANGHIGVQADAAVQLKAGSKFALTGTSIDFNGSVRAPSGSVALSTVAPVLSAVNNANEAQALTVTGRIDVSGSWINDLLDIRQSPVLAPLALNGGSITLSARGDLAVAAGANLLADGGARLTSLNAFKGGDGGSIKLVTNARTDNDAGSVLTLDGHVEAYGFGQGGKLALEANGIQIGGERGVDARTLHIDPLFFTAGGFSDFTLTANLIGLEIAPGTRLAPTQSNLQPTDRVALAGVASGANISGLVQPTLLNDYQRKPVNLHLSAVQTVNKTDSAFGPAYLRVGDGARIDADNAARVDLSTTGNLSVAGAITAHGGAINLSVTATPPDTAIDRGYLAGQSLWLGDKAVLDTSATVVRADKSSDLLLDKVLDAGSIKLTAERGFIAAEAGSVLDVSAPTAYTIALPKNLMLSQTAKSTTLNPAAGSIALRAAEGIASFATLHGQATGDGLAGSIAYLLDANSRVESRANNFAFIPLEIQVAQTQDAGALKFGEALPSELQGRALVSADAIAAGGFGSVDLSVRNKNNASENAVSNPGRIVFGSDVVLGVSDALTLGTTNIDVADHRVALSGATVTLGSDFLSSGGRSQVKEDTGVVPGAGTLMVDAKMLDVVGNVGIKGSANNLLRSAGDLRLRSVVDGSKPTARSLAAAELTTPGNLTLQAAQIYPSTLSDYTIRLSGADAVLSTLGNGVRTPVFSAGGKLTLQAPTIEHAGVLAAPLGSIALNAGETIHLATGSVIDVSAHDLLIPFGRLRGGELNWIYPILAAEPLVINSPPQKSVTLTAPNALMDNGATVDLSGGGDIYAFEQVPGPGGSKDFLDVANAKGAFAVLPALGSLTAPHDVVEMNGTGIAVGDTVWLDAGNGLPAGNYAVLPAHYALLPGAYLITPHGSSSPVASLGGKLVDGTTVVSGRLGRGLSGQSSAGYQSYTVETGAAARQRSEYTELTGAEFFKDKKVDVAADAGHMTIAAQNTLELNGVINAAAQNGRGAQLDIIADRIAVVNDAAEQVGDGVVKLLASAINRLGVDSLMLGGKRSRNGDDTNVEVLGSTISIQSGASLQAADVVLAARDSIDVGPNASVVGSGKSTVNQRAFVIEGDGALLRVSSAEQSNVLRNNSSGAGGDLRIDASSTLSSDRSMLLDSSRAMALPGTLAVNNGALNISTNRMSFGAVPEGTSGMALSNAQLSSLHAQTLRLSSRSSVDFFGDVIFTNQHTELNSAVLRNMAPGAVRVFAADTLQLENGGNSSTNLTDTAPAGSSLTLTANNIVLGRDGDAASSMQLQGFDTVQLGSQGSTRSVRGAGEFALHSNALTVYADSLAADTSGAKIQLLADGNIALYKAGTAAVAPAGELGATLTIAGKSVDLSTHLDMASGRVELAATGSAAGDNVTLRDGADIDVGGRSIDTQHASINTSGGSVKLTSTSGDIETQAGSLIRLDGGAKGGDGGSLTVAAAQGQALLNGALTAGKASGQRGATLAVDAGSLGSLNALLALVGSAGIDNSVTLRARTGDVAVATNVRATNIDIAADGGALSLASTLDASGSDGGHVALYARDDLHLQSNAGIDAHATADSGRGGRVELGSTAGALRLAGQIDVGGGKDGRDGQVNLRVARSADNTGVPVFDNGIAIHGAERVQLAAVKTYQSAVLDADLLETARLDAVDFMLNEAQIKAGLGALVSAKFHLVPEIEVQSSGDLAVATPVNFVPDDDSDYQPDSTWRFGAAFEAPVLTLRAAGNLDIAESLSDGVFTYKNPRSRVRWYTTRRTNERGDPQLLLSGDSASFRLVAGAELGAANPDAVGSSGNIALSNGADVVTGTGSLLLAAGGNIVVDSVSSLIASVGNTPYSNYQTPWNASGSFDSIENLPDSGTFNAIAATALGSTLPQYPQQGGDVSMQAGGDIFYAAPAKFFSSWLERVAGPFVLTAGSSATAKNYELTTWGVLLDFLKEGVVALGGGNVDIVAGGSISNLNAALPSTGKQVGVGINAVEITRSGNLSVVAGGDILSPRLLVDNGRAELRAGGAIGRWLGVDSDTQEPIIGLQTVAALGDATLLLRANGDVGVDAVFNSSVMPQSSNQSQGNFLKAENYFFTYGESAAVNIESVRGNVALNNDADAVLAAFNGDFPSHENSAGTGPGGIGSFGSLGEQRIFELYPSRLSVATASGDINVERNLLLFPSAHGQLTLLAGGDIHVAADVSLRESDVDPATLPNLYNSVRLLDVSGVDNSSKVIPRLFDAANLFAHASTPVHLNDDQPSIIDALGDILSGNQSFFELAEATWVAARDIVSTTFSIQNNRSFDVSEVVAQRDILYPLVIRDNGALQTDDNKIVISGLGRLDIFAGRDIELGTSQGFYSNGNQFNPSLPDTGADLSVYAGINGATALSDPTLFNNFVASYLSNIGGPSSGSYIDWFTTGAFSGKEALVTAFTGKKYASGSAALADFAALPVLTKQAISLEAWRSERLALLTGTASKSAYAALGGLVDANDYSADLIDFVSFDRFGGDLRSAVSAVTNVSYASKEEAATALASLSATQQHRVAQSAFIAAAAPARRELLTEIFQSEIRQGGIESQQGLVGVATRDGFSRSYAAIERMFPGDKWQGDISLVFSALRTFNDGDINVFAPGGNIDVGLAGQFAGVTKQPGELGIIAQRYGAINGFVDGDININQSRISSLDGAGIALWSTHGDIDAGRGAKTALTIPPPKVKVNDDGSVTLVFDAAVSGSGIQSARNNRKSAADRGALLADSTGVIAYPDDTQTDRDRYARSLIPGNTYLFAPDGKIDAGDAGITVEGGLFLVGTVVNASNISVGGVSVGVPTSSSISAGTLSLGNVASAATESATGSMNDAIKEAAAALATGNVAFVTVDIIGVGK